MGREKINFLQIVLDVNFKEWKHTCDTSIDATKKQSDTSNCPVSESYSANALTKKKPIPI